MHPQKPDGRHPQVALSCANPYPIYSVRAGRSPLISSLSARDCTTGRENDDLKRSQVRRTRRKSGKQNRSPFLQGTSGSLSWIGYSTFIHTGTSTLWELAIRRERLPCLNDHPSCKPTEHCVCTTLALPALRWIVSSVGRWDAGEPI